MDSSSSPAPDTIPVLHLKATEGAPGEFDNRSVDESSDARLDPDQCLDSSYERMMTDADLAPDNEPHVQARSVEYVNSLNIFSP